MFQLLILFQLQDWSFGKPRGIMHATLLKWKEKSLLSERSWWSPQMIKNRCLENKEETTGCGACEQGEYLTMRWPTGDAYESLNVMCWKCRWHKQEFEASRREKQRITISILRFWSNLSTFVTPILCFEAIKPYRKQVDWPSP